MEITSRAKRVVTDAAERKQYRVDLLPYMLLLPSVVLIGVVIAYPLLTGFLYSLRDGNLLQPGDFVGLQNFVELVQMPAFQYSAVFTLIYAIANIVGSYLIGLVVALLLNKKLPGRGLLRVAFLIPWIIPSVVAITGWRWMIADQHGMVNVMLRQLGMEPIFFLSNESWAIVSVIVVKVWRSFPFMMLSLLAALQTISEDLYEAAALDGAGRWQTFRYITFPHIKNVSIVLWILMTIWTINGFDAIWLLTGGGPSNSTESFIVLAYRFTFGRNQVGFGSAVAVISFFILAILAILMLRYQNRED